MQSQTSNTAPNTHGSSGPSGIKLESGRLKETKINICSYEMYEMELLDRALVSLQRTEDAYIDINNRIIDNVNQRKDRMNNINTRILGISQKILTLQKVNSAMRIVSPAHFPDIQKDTKIQHHPHQSMFFDPPQIQNQNQDGNDVPELSSLRLNKKLFNNRLQNQPEDLKKLVSGATKDINDISNLILSLQRYRSNIQDFKQGLNMKQSNSLAQEQQEGYLGRVPEDAESVAELMLFDSDINVYGDSNVYIPEFDFKTRITRPVQKNKKNQKHLAAQERERAKRNYNFTRGLALSSLQDAPDTIKYRGMDGGYNLRNQDTIAYQPTVNQAPELQFKQLIEGVGVVTDINEHDTKIKELEQKKREQRAQLQNQTTQQFNETMGTQQQQTQNMYQYNNQLPSQDANQSIADLESTLAPAAKRAQEKIEYEKKKLEEDELRRQWEEEKAQKLAQSGEPYENVKAIPINEIFQMKIQQKKDEMQKTLSKTMMDQNPQPFLTLQTTIETNTQTQLNYIGGQALRQQRSDSVMQYKPQNNLVQQQQQNTQQPPPQQNMPGPPQQQNQAPPMSIPPPPGMPPVISGPPKVAGGPPPPPPPPPIANFHQHLAGGKKGGIMPPPPGGMPPPPPPNLNNNLPQLPAKQNPPNILPPPPMNLRQSSNVKNSTLDIDGGSPINNRNNIPDNDKDDSMDLEKEILDITNQSFLNQSRINNPQFDQSRMDQSSNMIQQKMPPQLPGMQQQMPNFGMPPPPGQQYQQQQQNNLPNLNASQMMNQSQISQKSAMPQQPPVKALTFQEQIALAATKLKKDQPAIQQSKKEITQPPGMQRRQSHMDALKEQIMLRKASMNPTAKKNNGGEDSSMAQKSYLLSKFAQNDSMDEEENESDDSNFDEAD